MSHEMLLDLLKILVGGTFGGVLGFLLRYVPERLWRGRKRREMASLIRQHLLLVQSAISHVQLDNEKKQYLFSETNYAELIVGQFLYDLLTSNISLFDVKSLQHTIKFFHGFKVQMANIRARIDASPSEAYPSHPSGTLTQPTFDKLCQDLNASIQEMRQLEQNKFSWSRRT